MVHALALAVLAFVVKDFFSSAAWRDFQAGQREKAEKRQKAAEEKEMAEKEKKSEVRIREEKTYLRAAASERIWALIWRALAASTFSWRTSSIRTTGAVPQEARHSTVRSVKRPSG